MLNFTRITAGFLFLVAFSSSAFATTFHVPTEYLTIQAGINAAAVGDTVLLAPGLYSGDGNRDLDFNGKDITVRSEDNNPATCTLVCQGIEYMPHRGFIFQSGESSLARLEGITISGGSTGWEENNNSGGGILCRNGSSPTIRNCRVTQCHAFYFGGGLATIESSPTIRDCRFDHNDASLGGGIAVFDESQFIMTGSLVMNNKATEGGGVYLKGLFSYLSECVIADNDGAGIYALENFSLTYSTIIGNYTGIVTDRYFMIENTLITSNHSPFYCYDDEIELNCCNVYGNVLGDWSEINADQEGINGNISADPLLCDAANWDYHVAPDSPCLNDLCGQIGAFGAGDCGDPSSPAGDDLQVAFGLRGNYPNPFNPSTTIRYELEEVSPVMLQIFDVAGKLVRTLENGQVKTAGMHEAFWNGRDNAGHGAAAGIFLYVLTTSGGRDAGRMALIK